ncbi:hypothetical protein BDP27DRAFT_1241465, partial [Rhodocollybia butyracea]
VTGASGYLGSYITYQLLEQGFKVKGFARGEKVSLLKKAFSKYPGFEVIEITDIFTGDFGHFMKGLDAVIHCAAPMIAGKADPDAALKVINGAIDGSLHVLQQASDAGVHKVVVTGSAASFPMNGPFSPNGMFHSHNREKNPYWSDITLDMAKQSDNPGVIYLAQKKFSELAVVDFADKHPEMDVTIICPSYIFGPVAPGFAELTPTVNFRAFSSAFFLYSLVNGSNAIYPFAGSYCDIRDVTRVHILALDAPPSSVVGCKRFAIRHPEQSDFREAIHILMKERPQVKDRLPELSSAPEWPENNGHIVDYESIEKVLLLKKDSFKSWRETVLDGLDSVLAVENSWKAKGLEVVAPVGMPH